VPSHKHETLVELFRSQPTFALELLTRLLGVRMPEFDTVRLASGELNDIAPTEYRADAVVTLERDGVPVLGIVIEVQLRPDRQKRRSWPVYVVNAYARHDCPVVLLVFSPDQVVADWCATRIEVGGPGMALAPLVIGPRRIPAVTDRDTALRSPHLAILSAMAHGGDPDPEPVFGALVAALDTIDQDHADLYNDLVLASLPAVARKRLEEFMTTTGYRYESEFALRYFNKGKAEGEAEGQARGEAQAVLAILEARGVAVPDEDRARIATCTDLAQLDAWVRRAATAEKIQDLDGLLPTG
jgi:hypothetical protein